MLRPAAASMPTITVDRQDFFRRLGKEYSKCCAPRARRCCGADSFARPATEEFDELLFEYGLELDEDASVHC